MKVLGLVQRPAIPLLGLCLLASGLAVRVYGADVNDNVKAQTETVKNAQDSQKKIDKASDETQKMLEEYRLVLRQSESLKAYNDQMAKLVDSQDEEKGSLKIQIGEIELTSKEVVPLMLEMLSTLKDFVSMDVPFLLEEREARISSMTSEMNRADVSTSEKFRRILEAYQVESEYGRTIESYRGDVKADDGKSMVSVDFLKIGRVTLVYQTLDGKTSKVWDKASKNWMALGDEYRKPIQDGLKIAKKQSAPDLLTLPIPSPKEVTL